jgi:hypothetical protein
MKFRYLILFLVLFNSIKAEEINRENKEVKVIGFLYASNLMLTYFTVDLNYQNFKLTIENATSEVKVKNYVESLDEIVAKINLGINVYKENQNLSMKDRLVLDRTKSIFNDLTIDVKLLKSFIKKYNKQDEDKFLENHSKVWLKIKNLMESNSNNNEKNK